METTSGPAGSRLLFLAFLLTAAALAVLSIALAALPNTALERALAPGTHWRLERAATFVEQRRVDLAIVGIATLLVAVIAALPTVAG